MAFAISDHIWMMENGAIVLSGLSEQVAPGGPLYPGHLQYLCNPQQQQMPERAISDLMKRAIRPHA